MNVERLKKLRCVLETVAAAKDTTLNMGTWAESRAMPGVGTTITEGSCLTSACAAGWYVLMERPAGFGLRARGNTTHLSLVGPDGSDDPMDAFKSLENHFGLSEEDTERLFEIDTYESEGVGRPEPRHVIARIDELLAQSTA